LWAEGVGEQGGVREGYLGLRGEGTGDY